MVDKNHSNEGEEFLRKNQTIKNIKRPMNKFLQNFKNKDFFFLWLAQIISQFGDRMNQMALIGLIAHRMPGSAVGLAKLLSFTIIPVFLVGPIAGVYVDRWDRRVTLIICDVLRGLLVFTIPFVFMAQDSMIPIYLVVFLAFCLSRFYVPAKMSIVPDLVDKEDLLIVNSLLSVTGMIAFVFGCAFGGFLVERIGARGGFIIDAVTFFVSAFLVLFIRPRVKLSLSRRRMISTSREMISIFKKSVIEEMKDGVAYLFRQKEIRFTISMLFILFSAAGAIYVVIIVFIQQSFGSVTKDLGVLAVCLGVGLFLGAISYGRWGEKISAFRMIFISLILGGIALILFALTVEKTKNLFTALALAWLIGLIIGPIFIASNTIVHQVSDHQMRGKVFSGLEMVIHFAFLIAMLVSSYLSDYINRFWILMAIGIIFAVVGLGGLSREEIKDRRVRPQTVL